MKKVYRNIIVRVSFKNGSLTDTSWEEKEGNQYFFYPDDKRGWFKNLVDLVSYLFNAIRGKNHPQS